MELRYRQLDLLGEGGMGEVRLCEDAHLGRQVAMKVMRQGHAAKPELLDRFLGEVRIQGWLEHPAIVPVYDLALDTSGAPYFTMKRIHGTTLERVLAGLRAKDPRFADFTRQRLLVAFNKACLSVHYAHERGVCHRDLKPSNIMLGSYGEVYVLDWGIAELTGRGEAVRESSKPGTSSSGGNGVVVTGTAGYMAPELARGMLDAIDARTDVYALGAILFEILALVPLHDHATQMDILQATATGADDARPSLRAPGAAIPPELDAICVKATSIDASTRFQSARELHDEVERFLARDRTLEQRRERAERHASSAATAAQRAFEETDPRAIDRREALRSSSRALALDPSNALALRTLQDLLATPPRSLPQEVAAELGASTARLQSRVLRGSAYLLLSWFAYLPFALITPIRDVRLYLALSAVFVASAVASFRLSRHPPKDGKVPLVNLAPAAAVSIAMAWPWGPFIVVPCFSIVTAALVILIHRERGRLIPTVIATVSSVPLAVLLETFGLMPPSLASDRGALLILPRLVDFPPATPVIITAVHLMFVLSCSAWFIHFRAELDRNERRLALQAWQLRHLVPAEAEPGRMSTGPRSLPPPAEPIRPVAATKIDTHSRVGALDATIDDGNAESRYDVLETIGGDAVGDVLLCRDRRMGREVAMKMLRAEYAGDTAKVSRFLREACLQAKLEHPSIVPIYDLGMTRAGNPFVTMKRLRGTTMAEALEDLRRAGEPAESPRLHKLLEAFITACLAVEYAHASGVVHGGLRADSILLGDYGELYVTGWGAASMNRESGVLADLRALGTILFELLTLAHFEGAGAQDTRPSLRFPERDVAPELDAVCMKAMSAPDEGGYRTVRELREAIERFLDGERDVARRRAVAVEHEHVAATSLDQALAGGPRASEARARAMREVTRALALDSSNVRATALLMRLLTEPPRELPAEAAEAVRATGYAHLREVARIAAFLYGIWFLCLPLLLMLGIRDARLYGLVSLAFVAAILAFGRTARSRRTSGEEYADVVVSMIAAASLATIAGSLILVPCLVVANLAGFLFQIGPRRRVLVVGLGCLAIVVPLLLERAGVLPPSYAFRDGKMAVLPHLLELTRPGAIGILTVVHMALVGAACFFFARFRALLSRAEDAAHLNGWQLRQLVPFDLAKPD
jgi:eukaryotic-like serine/threonine-protein kinase